MITTPEGKPQLFRVDPQSLPADGIPQPPDVGPQFTTIFMVSSSQLSVPSVISITVETAPLPPPVPTGTPSPQPTETITFTAQVTSTGTASFSTSTKHGLTGKDIAAILLPIILVAALAPILVFGYLHWRHKRNRRGPPVLRLPPETRLLDSCHNSMSIPSPFLDGEDIGIAKTTSQRTHRYDRPSAEQSRSSSPAPQISSVQTFPSPLDDGNNLPGQSQTFSLGSYAQDNLFPEPPPPYAPQSASLRPPSTYGRVHTRFPSPSLTEANMSSHNMRYPFSDLETDSISDVSSEHGSGVVWRRRRDIDEMSFVSALDPEEYLVRNPHQTV